MKYLIYALNYHYLMTVSNQLCNVAWCFTWKSNTVSKGLTNYVRIVWLSPLKNISLFYFVRRLGLGLGLWYLHFKDWCINLFSSMSFKTANNCFKCFSSNSHLRWCIVTSSLKLQRPFTQLTIENNNLS